MRWFWTVAEMVVQPFADPGSRTWLGSLVVSALVAGVVVLVTRRDAPLSALGQGLSRTWRSLRHRSSILDIQLLILRQLLRAIGVLPGLAAVFWLASWGVRGLDAGLGRPELSAVPTWAVGLGYTLLLFVAWDASRFALHWAMHRVPALWSIHQVHHSASVLTPLTFHRLHPLESVLYTARAVVVTTVVLTPTWWLFRDAATMWTVLGVHGLGLIFNVATGNLRHSHLWLRFGPVERWLISPAQHQLHHSVDERDQACNLGTWLSIWDRMAGTLRLSGPLPPTEYGVTERNHDDDVISALIGPLRDLGRRSAPGAVTAIGLLLVAAGLVSAEPARADDPAPADSDDKTDGEDGGGDAADDDPYDDYDDDMVVVVETEGGMPRVAGSAQVVTEQELERFEMDDVGRVLVSVPGVYVRGEDGLGLRPNIGLRGAASNRSSKITLLEDGIPFGPAPYAAPAAYYFPMTTRMVGIDVIKGPAAIQNGPNTVGGAVNLRTRPVPHDGFHGYADLAAGSWTSGKAHVWLGGGDNRGGWLVEGVHLGTKGFWEADHGGPVGTRRTELMAKGRLYLRNDADRRDALEVKLGLAHEDSRSTYLGLHPDDYDDNPWRRYLTTSEARMQWTRNQATLSYLHTTPGKLQLRVTAYRHQLHRDWRKFNAFAGGTDAYEVLTSPDAGANAPWLALLRGQADSLTPDENLLIGNNDRSFVASGVSGLARFVARDGDGPTLRGEVGLRVHYDDVHRLHTYDTYAMQDGALVATDADRVTTRDDTAHALAFAAHTAWDLGLGDFHVEPGFRTEVIRTWIVDATKPEIRVHPLPGLGLRYQPSEHVAVFGGAYRGFSPVAPEGAQDAQPETAWNGEIGVRAQQGSARGELTGFISDYRNLTGQCTFSSGCTDDQVGDQFNAGQVRVVGVEAAASHDVDLGRGFTLPVGATATFTDATFLTTFQSAFPQFGSVEMGDKLPYLPRWQGTGRIGINHYRASLDGSVEAVSGQLDTAGDLTEPDVAGRALVHASARVRILDQLQVYTTAQNLLNSTAVASLRPLGPRPVGRRTFWIGIKAEL